MISGIRDNYCRGSVGSFLREQMLEGSHVSIVSAYFTIYAYAALQAEMDGLAGVRFLSGCHQVLRTAQRARAGAVSEKAARQLDGLPGAA